MTKNCFFHIKERVLSKHQRVKGNSKGPHLQLWPRVADGRWEEGGGEYLIIKTQTTQEEIKHCAGCWGGVIVDTGMTLMQTHAMNFEAR